MALIESELNSDKLVLPDANPRSETRGRACPLDSKVWYDDWGKLHQYEGDNIVPHCHYGLASSLAELERRAACNQIQYGLIGTHKSPRLDFRRLKRWLDDCDENHPECKRSDDFQRQRPQWLVDIERRCLVGRAADMHLSAMCGKIRSFSRQPTRISRSFSTPVPFHCATQTPEP